MQTLKVLVVVYEASVFERYIIKKKHVTVAAMTYGISEKS